MKKLTFVTGNKQKLLEVMEIVKRLSLESRLPSIRASVQKGGSSGVTR